MGERPKGMSIDFAAPAGEPALLPPDSVHWQVFRNPIALGVGGVAAVLMEFADPRIRSGVWDHSVYKHDPIGRSQRTGMAAMAGVYGPARVARAVIGGVNRMHAHVQGQTPGGQTYHALEPDLLNWVHATAAFGFLKAYDRFVKPVPAAEQALFWREGTTIAALYGATASPDSEAGFHALMARLADGFQPHAIVLEFLGIIASGRAAPGIPRVLHRALARGAVSLLPRAVGDALALGPEWSLTLADRAMLRAAGRAAEWHRDLASPAAQAARRLGLPPDTAWRPRAQRTLLWNAARTRTREAA